MSLCNTHEARIAHSQQPGYLRCLQPHVVNHVTIAHQLESLVSICNIQCQNVPYQTAVTGEYHLQYLTEYLLSIHTLIFLILKMISANSNYTVTAVMYYSPFTI